MDGSRFDRLVVSLVTTGSRRRAVASVLVGALGLLSAQPNESAAKKKPCPPCKKRKAGKCKKTLPDGTACENGGSCLSGSCRAASVVPPPVESSGVLPVRGAMVSISVSTPPPCGVRIDRVGVRWCTLRVGPVS